MITFNNLLNVRVALKRRPFTAYCGVWRLALITAVLSVIFTDMNVIRTPSDC